MLGESRTFLKSSGSCVKTRRNARRVQFTRSNGPGVSSVSLPRDRFWDIPVPKIDSPTRQPIRPRPSCVRHDSVSHIAAELLVHYSIMTPTVTLRRFGCALCVPCIAPYRSQFRPHNRAYAYRGLPAFASLSLAGSVGQDAKPDWAENRIGQTVISPTGSYRADHFSIQPFSSLLGPPGEICGLGWPSSPLGGGSVPSHRLTR